MRRVKIEAGQYWRAIERPDVRCKVLRVQGGDFVKESVVPDDVVVFRFDPGADHYFAGRESRCSTTAFRRNWTPA